MHDLYPDYERAAYWMQQAKRQGRIDRIRPYVLPVSAFVAAIVCGALYFAEVF